MKVKFFFVLLSSKPTYMLNKKSTFILAVLLGCSTLTIFTACNSSETKPADTDAKKMETTTPPATTDTGATRPLKPTAPITDTAATRPLKPTNP